MVEAVQHHLFPPGGKKVGPYQQEINPPPGAAVVAVQFVHELGELSLAVQPTRSRPRPVRRVSCLALRLGRDGGESGRAGSAQRQPAARPHNLALRQRRQSLGSVAIVPRRHRGPQVATQKTGREHARPVSAARRGSARAVARSRSGLRSGSQRSGPIGTA
jgi:hypothetical protein